MSTREFRLPDLGEGLTESDLVSWHVAAGDTVELNQVIAEVETAKALVDLPSPYAGVVTALHAEPGQTVNVGEPLVTFEVPDDGDVPGGTPSSGGSAGRGSDGGASARRARGGGVTGQVPDGGASAGSSADGDGELADEAPQPNLVGYGARPERSGRPARRARRAPARGAIEIGQTGAGSTVGTPTSPISTSGPEHGPRPGTGTGTGAGVGTGIITGAGAGAAPDGAPPVPTERPRSTPPVRRLAKLLGVHLERVVGTGARGLVTREDVLAAVSCAQTGAGDSPGAGTEQRVDRRSQATDRATTGQDATGVDGHDDESDLRTTGRFAPTSLRDILGQSGLARAAARRVGSFPPPDADRTPAAPDHGTGATSSGRDARRESETRTPVRGVRKHTAAAMVASAFTAPQATVFLTVDVTPSTELLDRLRIHPLARGTRITVLALVARALCVVLPRHPSLASRWEDLPDGSAEIVHSPRVHLGIAVATERGLVVPHVPDAHTLGLTGLAEALAELTATARSGRTAPERLTGGTLTITNVGVFGVDAGTPILVPGEAAILGVGAVRRRPWEHEGQVSLRDVVTLSLSFDHRVVDGEQGARFLAELGALLADPALALLLAGDPGTPADPAAPRTGAAS
ncbi:dihydrolipoamide acetyltransferase family protein [Oerskovia sp. NPDC060338]|uniref:dihydrolipoamide acetyltransferase family protein n=1 Tax=Oerskovia sp. NPDC060338 TaxID=3347100 RepID=UPI00365352C6